MTSVSDLVARPPLEPLTRGPAMLALARRWGEEIVIIDKESGEAIVVPVQLVTRSVNIAYMERLACHREAFANRRGAGHGLDRRVGKRYAAGGQHQGHRRYSQRLGKGRQGRVLTSDQTRRSGSLAQKTTATCSRGPHAGISIRLDHPFCR